jgi:hypothetical protein
MDKMEAAPEPDLVVLAQVEKRRDACRLGALSWQMTLVDPNFTIEAGTKRDGNDDGIFIR